MAELARKTGNFPLFSIDTPSRLQIFGGSTISTDIDAIVDTTEFKKGWGYLNETVAPPEQDFNALGYALSYVASYYLQKGIPEWSGTDGVIGGQEYIAGKSFVGHGGDIYVALLNSGGSVAARVPTNATYWEKVSKTSTITTTGTATFTNSTNNIALTGIGTGVDVGDVIQITGSTNNNGEFTIEVMTDANNIIVNQAHAGKSRTVQPIGTKALINETATATITLLAKWYNAPNGLGQGITNVLSARSLATTYPNNTKRNIGVSVGGLGSLAGNFLAGSGGAGVSRLAFAGVQADNQYAGINFNTTSDYSVTISGGTLSNTFWYELR